MIQDIDLRELAEMSGPDRAFLTCCFPRSEGFGALKNRIETVRCILAASPEEREHFEESLKRVEAWLKEEKPKGEGICVFASGALDFFRGYSLELPVPAILRVAAAPYIRPLAELQNEYERFLVVAVDNTSARILHVTSAKVQDEDRVRGDVKNRVKKGGWSQKRYARRRENELHHYAKEIDEVLARLVREERFERIVLVGSEEAIHELRENLSTDVAARVVGSRAVDLKAGDDSVMDEALGLYFDEERAAEQRLWDRIKDESLSDGLGTTGATAVLAALTEGRVESVLVERDAKIKGTRCRDCETIVHGTPQTCQRCGSRSVFRMDLVEEMVQLAERTSASVEFADPIEGLVEVGGVAALLRY